MQVFPCTATTLHSTVTASLSSLRHPVNALLLSISLALIPAFGFWSRTQERRQRPALIPNSLWKNTTFVSICLMALLSYAVMAMMELFSSLL